MIEGKRVKLRGFELDDLDEVHRAMNNPNMTRYLRVMKPFSKEDEEEWIKNTWKRRKEGTHYAFAIEDKEKGELIGSISLMNVEQENKRAELGIWIKEEYWGKGYGTEAEKLMTKYGFEELNLNSIHARAYSFNERSQRAIKSIGFKENGKQRAALYRHGDYHDAYYYDMLKEEWEKKQS